MYQEKDSHLSLRSARDTSTHLPISPSLSVSREGRGVNKGWIRGGGTHSLSSVDAGHAEVGVLKWGWRSDGVPLLPGERVLIPSS